MANFTLGNYEEALACYNKAYSIQEHFFGPEDSRSITVQERIAEAQAKIAESEK